MARNWLIPSHMTEYIRMERTGQLGIVRFLADSLFHVISVRTEVILANYTLQIGMRAARMTCNYDVLQVSPVCNGLQGNKMKIVLLS